MLEGAINLPSFQKTTKNIYNNFRVAAVRKKYEDEIRKTLSGIKDKCINNEARFESEYAATIGIERNKLPAFWRERALTELAQKYPLEEETISWWQWQNRGKRHGFKRNAYFTTPVEVSVRDQIGEIHRLTRPLTAYEMYNRDFPMTALPSWFHPLPCSDGVRILRDSK